MVAVGGDATISPRGPDQLTPVLGQVGPPPGHRVVVVGAGVDDLVVLEVGQVVGVVLVGRLEPELQHGHPRQAQLLAQVDDGLVDVAEVLREQRQRAQRLVGRVEHPTSGALFPPATQGGLVAGRDGPVGREPPEVVQPDEVEQPEGPAQPLDPPRVAVVAQDVPAVERVAPQLAGRGIRIRRAARHAVGAEELRPGPLVGAVGRDVDGDVAEDPDPAVPRVPAKRRPLAVEPHLVGEVPAERGPRVDPVGLPRRERLQLRVAHRGVRLLQQGGGRGERRRRLVGRTVLVGDGHRQHLPDRLTRLDEPVDEVTGRLPEPPARQRRDVQLHAAGAGVGQRPGSVHGLLSSPRG